MARFAIAVVFEGPSVLAHELYMVRARDAVHAEGIALHHASRDGRPLISLLVTPAMTATAITA